MKDLKRDNCKDCNKDIKNLKLDTQDEFGFTIVQRCQACQVKFRLWWSNFKKGSFE